MIVLKGLNGHDALTLARAGVAAVALLTSARLVVHKGDDLGRRARAAVHTHRLGEHAQTVRPLKLWAAIEEIGGGGSHLVQRGEQSRG